jgi:uncharacterized membrane protein
VIAPDRGSTVPLILGFFLLALLGTAGAVAAGQAFVQQRDLQDLCDGAAAATAAAAADVDRSSPIANAGSLRFVDVQRIADRYVSRELSGVSVRARVSSDGRILRVRCSTTKAVIFGAVFGKAHGVLHIVESSAREPVT